MKQRAVSVFIGVIVFVTAALAILFGARSERGRDRTQPLDPGVEAMRIEHPATHWSARGFVEMVPPVRLPSNRAGTDRIRVWLKVGEGKIGSKELADGRVVLDFPPHTIAYRVESMGDAVIDVRGTVLVDDGELFHVYVPEAEAPSALVGWQWRRGNFAAEASATQALLARLDLTRRALRGAPAATEAQHQNSLRSYERNNNCGGCHAHEKPLVWRGDTVHRPTDADGFFVPLSVLADVVPLERHRPWEMNANDPFLRITCASGSTPQLQERGETRQLSCASFEIPGAELDVERALAARDERTLAMCASRRYLFEHMNEEARARFARAFAACGIASES